MIEPGLNMSDKYAAVILDDLAKKTLDYEIPSHLLGQVKAGMRIQVPLRNALREGVVFKLKKESKFSPLKPIAKILSSEVITKDLFELAIWMSRYYATPLGKVIKKLVPSSVRQNTQLKKALFISLNKSKKETLKLISSLILKHPAQVQILEFFLKAKKGFFLSEIVKLASRSSINTLIKKKILKSVKLNISEEDLFLNFEYFPSLPKKLTKEQTTALDQVSNSLSKKLFQVHLLHGITGSGKTEVYLQAIQQALDLGHSALLLVPEIALTTQTIERFKARFHQKLAILHHKRSAGERHQAWKDLSSGEVKIAIGARSAIFAPLKNLGLIIVDEEHDASYKNSEEEPAYHARHLAIVRGKLNGAQVILGSATPSMESYSNALNGKYNLLELTKRAQKAQLPTVEIVNLKAPINKSNQFSHFSDKLLSAIKSRFQKGEQTLLFLNRRGYRSFLFCPKCAHTIKCPHCDLALTFHKKNDLLLCHMCDFQQKPVATCPSCKKAEPLKYKGYGTEHVEAYLKAIFPEIRTLRIDRDTTTTKHSHTTLFKEFRAGKADVLIGTQMIVKGLHFPAVTLVCVLNSDGALNIPDFRSSETVFQLICQVAGRAGRGELKGEVIIQTYNPENNIIKLAAKQDFLAFYKEEIISRKLFNFPPFMSFIKFNFSALDEKLAQKTAEKFRQKLISKITADDKIHPVVASGRPKAHDKYRFFFLVRGKKILPLSKAIAELKKEFKLPKEVHLFVDVDPISTYF